MNILFRKKGTYVGFAMGVIAFCFLLFSSCSESKKQQEEKDFKTVVEEAIINNPEGIKMSVKKHIVNAGDSMHIELPCGTNVVYSVIAELRGDVKDVIVSASFDGAKTVEVPFSYFTDNSSIECNDFMPYTSNSSFIIKNCSKKDIDATLSIKTIPIQWDEKVPYYAVNGVKMAK